MEKIKNKKEKKKLIKKVLIGLIPIISIILIPFIIYFFIIKPNIYYIIDYDIDILQEERIIDKGELFEYQKYLKCIEDCRELSYVDREFINSWKAIIDNDTGFHLDPGYYHYFIYEFKVREKSKIYLDYDNNTIYNAKYEDNSTIFYNSEGIFYLNFTIVPYVSKKTTISLTNIILIEMSLEYSHKNDFCSAIWKEWIQYAILDKYFNVILICVSNIMTAP
ncbi:MAG: hypothetical protein ACTSQG_06935 [Promethearchaeota archaeon]